MNKQPFVGEKEKPYFGVTILLVWRTLAQYGRNVARGLVCFFLFQSTICRDEVLRICFHLLAFSFLLCFVSLFSFFW